MLHALGAGARKHFELLFYLYLWLAAAVLAVLAGRPALGLVGLGTVLPFAVLYARRVKASARGAATRGEAVPR